jgi:hypothetical protein
MKMKIRLLLAFAAPLLTAAPASAWWCHRYRVPMAPMQTMGMPMMSMPMMSMPMMGMQTMSMPMMGMGGVMPMGAMGTNGMGMSLSISGDMGMGLLMPGLLRNLIGTFLGTQAPAGMTEQQIVNLARQVLTGLVSAEAGPFRPFLEQLAQLNNQMSQMNNRLANMNQTLGIPSNPPKKGSGATPPPEELEQARAAVRRLAARPVAQNEGRVSSADLERARAAVRRLAAGSTGATDGRQRAPADLEKARAAVRRLAAGEAVPQAGQARPTVNTMARVAK